MMTVHAHVVMALDLWMGALRRTFARVGPTPHANTAEP